VISSSAVYKPLYPLHPVILTLVTSPVSSHLASKAVHFSAAVFSLSDFLHACLLDSSAGC
jgi:hypothetical protein